MNAIEEKCLKKGVRLTDQRKTIAKVISESKEVYGSKDHPDVDELHKRVSQIDKKIIFQIISDISGNKLKKSLKLSRPKTAKEYLISNYGKFLYENWFKPYYRNLFFDKNPSPFFLVLASFLFVFVPQLVILVQ